MTVDTAGLDEAIAAINKKYKGAITKASEYEKPARLSSRSLALDIAMGGGWPYGRISRIYGPYSSTKTMNCLNATAEAQACGMKCAWWDVEKALDTDLAKKVYGIDIDDLLRVNGQTIQAMTEQMDALLPHVHFHVIDSASAAVSSIQLEGDAYQQFYAPKARAWGGFFDRIMDRMGPDNMILIIDQIRTNIKTGASQPAGGNVIDHNSSMSVNLKKGKWLFRNENGYLDPKAKQGRSLMNDMTHAAGVEIKARVDKSRVGRPHIAAEMRIDYDLGNWDWIFDHTEAARVYGLVEARGSGNYYYPPKVIKGKKQRHIKGIDALRDMIVADPDMRKKIRTLAIDRAARGMKV